MNQPMPQMPEIRNIPVWSPEAKIEITGYEWEAIQNGLATVQYAQQAAQAVMSRNILNGTIKMDFEKLNPATMQYEPMTDDEKRPHLEKFAETIASVKAQADASIPLVNKDATESIIENPNANPEAVILNAAGEPASAGSEIIIPE